MDITSWHQWVIQPLQQLGAAVLDLDHTGHRTDGRPRGSSAKEAVAEACWYLSAEGQFDPTSTTTVRLKRGLKNRRGALPRELCFKVGGDGQGGFIFEPLAGAVSSRDERQASKERAIKAAIAALVRRHHEKHGEPLSLSAITKAVTGPRAQVSELAKELGTTPMSGFKITTGPRNAVLLGLTGETS